MEEILVLKILIITQWFDPEPTFKGLLFAKELVAAGHTVNVVTGFPNYPGGKVYDGYKIKLLSREVVDGVVIYRVPLYPSHDQGALKRVVNYVSFAMSSCLCGIFRIKRADVIYSYHPPLTTTLSAMVISFFKRTPFIVDIQDLWPDTLTATGMLNNRKILSIVDMFCHLVYRKASKVVVLSPGFKKTLISRGVPAAKLEVIYNWCDETALNNAVESDVLLPENGQLNLLFAGNLGFAQGIPSIVEAAKKLQDDAVKINIVLLGDGVAKEQAVIQSKKLDLNNIFFLPRVPMSEVGGLLKKADILLVHLTDDELFSITIPSRTQAYLAIGKPIIMGVNGDAADLIKRSKSGITCEANNAQSLADAIFSMIGKTNSERAEMSKNAHNFYQTELSVSVGINKFITIFNEAIK